MDEELEKIRERKKEEMAKKTSYPNEPVEITNENFTELLEKYPLLVVDCWASWCMPCKMIEPVIEELVKEYAGKIVFGKINVDEQRELAMKFNIMSIPTLLFFKDGQVADTLIGALPKEQIEEKIKSQL
ncbi:MAG: thioredoxin [Candidatus Altiarchaeales archaeon]|nr:thioredoxin [Candidatus Altiarchaeota archaeon]MCG2782078.1 thioredoxin [Candidatus Altiarchaeales archaeon]MBU4266143.1 thioredoxin [Candidatus Altiarchaeota archaeon]MBU4341034.1 thioredoxin [Candidatus Altiarchaeota archaeon]MBU4406947.1 thioredoxin [Candidatus Altiarchaeota archaeon]